jgi:hydrophobic/amphiphilic exporter-1 (mainly G- bacteria), HAE1 family
MIHTDFALRRPVTTLMTFAAVAVIGLVGARLLPLEQFPDVTFPFMGVNIPYPGSTPEEIEELITRPVEDALATLPGIKEIRSSSNEDSANLQIGFDWGTDVDAAGFEVRTKLDSIRSQLPRTANRILMFTASSADQPIVTVRLSASRDLSSQYEVLDRYLKKPIERIDGVARAVLAGVEPREVRILVDAGRIAAHGIEMQRLVSLLERSNFSVSAGQITAQGERLSVRPIGEFRTLDDIRNLVISGNVHIGDVAQVELVSPQLQLRRHLNGRPAVGVDVFKSTQANIVQVVDRVLDAVEHAKEVPQMQGISVFVIDNQAHAIRQSLGDVREAGLIGGALAFLVLFLFLRHWPTTLIVSLAVPLSLLCTLAALYFFGLSINVMSMMGMMLAIGMLVDNAVVVTESVYRHRQMDASRPIEATLTGVREVGVATLAGTATCVVVFLPILFGSRNQITIFLTHVAVPIVVAMIASLIIAQTLIPMLTSRFPSPPTAAARSWIARLQARYASALTWSLTHGRATALGLVGVLLLTGGLIAASVAFPDKLLKVSMFTQDAGRQVVVDYRIRGSHPIERVEAAVETMEGFLRNREKELDIERLYTVYAADEAYSVIMLREGGIKNRDFVARLEGKLPEILIGQPTFNLDNQSGQDQGRFSLQVTGESTERLATVADDLVRVLRSVPGLSTVQSEARQGDEEVQITVDRSRTAALGLDPRQVAMAVSAALRGETLREFRGSDRELKMRLAFRESDRQNMDDLARLPLFLPNGQHIDLGAVADFRVARGARTIERTNRLTAVLITGNLDRGATLNTVQKSVTTQLADYRLPPGYAWKFGRGFENEDEAAKTMLFNLLLAIAMIYLVMAAVFESSVLPVSIITSIFMAMVGVLWFLFATRTTVTFMALIGVQILIGVVVNIGIVLVAHINDLRAAGLERLEAIVQAGRDRLRPILMTTLTASLGLLPLADLIPFVDRDAQLAVGVAGPSYAPMARAIMGGLLFGAVTSLFVVPSFYVWLDDAIQAARRFFGRTRLAAKLPEQHAEHIPGILR